MERKVLAVVAAIALASSIFLIAVMIATIWAPFPPQNLEYLSRDQIASFFPTLPLGGYITALIGFILGTFAAGWITAKISKQFKGITLPLIVGILFILGGIGFFTILPGQPGWFVFVVLVSYIPVALLGHRTASVYLHP
jgi:hypothetical protein